MQNYYMSEYQTLLTQIAQLQTRADALRETERREAISQVNSLVQQFGISAREITFSVASQKNLTKKPDKRSKVEPRYTDSKGNMWSGRGQQPRWLVEAIAGGGRLESFLIQKPI
jgi:DNA-binding protein H-NS